VRTLLSDFSFATFNANATLMHGEDGTYGTRAQGIADPPVVEGPTGSSGGQGHYGLHMVGDASLENCNASHACCDTYNKTYSRDPVSGAPVQQSCRGGLVCR
jgi:hypothetical protein